MIGISRGVTFWCALWLSLLFATPVAGSGIGPGQPASAARRLISLLPSQTELICALGFERDLVGISDYCNFPEAVTGLPHIGGMELNLEKIVSLRPTAVIDGGGMHRRYELFFRQVGIPYLDYPLAHLTDIPAAAASLAADLHRPEAGVAFLKSWEEKLAALPTKAEPGPRVYVEIWDTPLQAAGPTSFIGELVERAGGQNILPAAGVPFPVVNPEEVIRTNPQVIIVAYPVTNTDSIGSRPGWSDIEAVRKGNVHPVEVDVFVRPSPRCLQAIATLARLMAGSR